MHDRVYLRKILNEMIPVNGVDSDTLFTNEQLDDLLTRFPSTNYAAAVGWSIKAGKLADLVDIEESGSKRRLAQKYANALKMADFYTKLAGADQTAIAAAVRVVGQPVNPYVTTQSPVPLESIVEKQAGGVWIDYQPAYAGEVPIGYTAPEESQQQVSASQLPIELERGRTYRLSVTYWPGGVLTDLTDWAFVMQIKHLVTDVDPAWEGTVANGGLSVDAAEGTINVLITGVQAAGLVFDEGLYELVATSPTGDSIPVLSGPVFVNSGVVAGV